MILRLLLSISMMTPALPARPECADCTRRLPDACRAWIASQCAERDACATECRIDIETSCGGPDRDADSSGTCTLVLTCCAGSEPPDEAPPRLACETACCEAPDEATAARACGTGCGAAGFGASAEPAACGLPVPGTVARCEAEGSPESPQRCVLVISCERCYCCPQRVPRPVEPRQTPAAQRAASDKQKADEPGGPGRVVPVAFTPTVLPRADVRQAPVGASRQAALCIWRE